MKKIFAIITISLILFSLNSCSNNDEKDDINEIIPEGLTVTSNGTTRIYDAKVEEFIEEKGTVNEHINLVVSGRIKNSNERIFFSLIQGKIGINIIHSLTYVNSNNEVHYYFPESGFSTIIIKNNLEKKLEGKFSGKMYANTTSITTDLIGTFNIQY